jgi:hypothetical protein
LPVLDLQLGWWQMHLMLSYSFAYTALAQASRFCTLMGLPLKIFPLCVENCGMIFAFSATPSLARVRATSIRGMHIVCEVSCDHIPRRSWALFRARDVMRGVIESFKAEQTA